MVSYVAFATFSISDSGKNFLEEDSSRTVMLPILSEVNERKSSKSQSIPRRGKWLPYTSYIPKINLRQGELVCYKQF